MYNDPTLRAALCSGKKIHALFGMEMYPGKTYEDILASADTEFDMYTKGKQGVFGMIYGGDWNTLVGKFGLPPEVAQRAEDGFFKKFPGIPKAREKTFNAFCSMKQPGGLGTAVVWADPAEYIESFLGFRRYFSLENKICKALFDLARKPPKNWAGVRSKSCGAIACRRPAVRFLCPLRGRRSVCRPPTCGRLPTTRSRAPVPRLPRPCNASCGTCSRRASMNYGCPL